MAALRRFPRGTGALAVPLLIPVAARGGGESGGNGGPNVNV